MEGSSSGGGVASRERRRRMRDAKFHTLHRLELSGELLEGDVPTGEESPCRPRSNTHHGGAVSSPTNTTTNTNTNSNSHTGQGEGWCGASPAPRSRSTERPRTHARRMVEEQEGGWITLPKGGRPSVGGPRAEARRAGCCATVVTGSGSSRHGTPPQRNEAVEEAAPSTRDGSPEVHFTTDIDLVLTDIKELPGGHKRRGSRPVLATVYEESGSGDLESILRAFQAKMGLRAASPDRESMSSLGSTDPNRRDSALSVEDPLDGPSIPIDVDLSRALATGESTGWYLNSALQCQGFSGRFCDSVVPALFAPQSMGACILLLDSPSEAVAGERWVLVPWIGSGILESTIPLLAGALCGQCHFMKQSLPVEDRKLVRLCGVQVQGCEEDFFLLSLTHLSASTKFEEGVAAAGVEEAGKEMPEVLPPCGWTLQASVPRHRQQDAENTPHWLEVWSVYGNFFPSVRQVKVCADNPLSLDALSAIVVRSSRSGIALWLGAEVNNLQRGRAVEWAHHLKSQSPHLSYQAYDECDDDSEFWELLQEVVQPVCPVSYRELTEEECDDSRKGVLKRMRMSARPKPSIHLFRVFINEFSRPQLMMSKLSVFHRSVLASEEFFILDNLCNIHIWIGLACPPEVVRGGFEALQVVLETHEVRRGTRVIFNLEGEETRAFKVLFADWPVNFFNRLLALTDPEDMDSRGRSPAPVENPSNPGTPTRGQGSPLLERFKSMGSIGLEAADAGTLVGAPPQLQRQNTVERMLARRGSVLYNMDRSRPDDAAGAVQIWLFREPQLAVLPQDEYGCFFEGETYMVLYIYEEELDIKPIPTSVFHKASQGPLMGNRAIIYLWQGKTASPGSMLAWKFGCEQTLLDKIRHDVGCLPVVKPIRQFEETKHFMQVFNGGMVLRKGRRPSSGETTGVHLFQIRGSSCEEARAVEVELAVESLCSADCFLLVTPAEIFTWFGSKSTSLEHDVCLDIIPFFQPRDHFLPVHTLEEGHETEDFWKTLLPLEESLPEDWDRSLRARYLSSALVHNLSHVSCKLFECKRQERFSFKVREIVDFSQNSLDSSSVYLLDAKDEVFLWIGIDSLVPPRHHALSLAKEYTRVSGIGTSHWGTITIVLQGQEPSSFTCHFLGWERRSGVKWFRLEHSLERQITAMELDRESEEVVRRLAPVLGL